jgi:hypothetical protein
MGLILRGDDNAPTPRRVDLVLSCDGKHGLFQGEKPIVTFSEGGYVANRRAAAAAGWVVTTMGKVFCPACKGKNGEGQ